MKGRQRNSGQDYPKFQVRTGEADLDGFENFINVTELQDCELGRCWRLRQRGDARVRKG